MIPKIWGKYLYTKRIPVMIFSKDNTYYLSKQNVILFYHFNFHETLFFCSLFQFFSAR